VQQNNVDYISREAEPRRNVYWPWPSVFLSVCLSLAAFPHYCTDPDVTWGNGKGCPLVVQCWVDLQPVHRFRCYDNTHVRKLVVLYTAHVYSAECEMSVSACNTLHLCQSTEGTVFFNSKLWLKPFLVIK